MEDNQKEQNPLIAEFQALNPVTAEATTQRIMANAKKNTIPDNIKALAAELEQEAAAQVEQGLETVAQKVKKVPVQGAMENMAENKVAEPVGKSMEVTEAIPMTAEEIAAEDKEWESLQSSTGLPSVVPASVDSQKVDEDTARVVKLAQDIRDYSAQPGAISMVMKALCERVPEIFPNYTTWGCDPIPLMHAKIQAPGYIEALLNSLFLMLNDSIWNIRWSAQVVIGMTATLVMLDMPQIIYEAHLRKEQEDHPIVVPEKPKLILP